MFASAFFLFFLSVSSHMLYSAAVEKKDLPLTVGLGCDQGLHYAYSEVTDRFKTVITILTTQNRYQEKTNLNILNDKINRYAHAVPAEIVDAQMVQATLHRQVEDAVLDTYKNCKAQLSALIVLLHEKGVWRADYNFAYDTDASIRSWKCSKVSGAFDPSQSLKIIDAGFRCFDFISPHKQMTWPQVAEHQILNNQRNKLQSIPSGVVLLVDLKIWQEYLKNKQSASWMHTLSSIDLSSIYGLAAYLPDLSRWSTKK
ncbi:MAG: hypothetical protein WD055_06285 [Candidatus Dependentiae bacterium]